MRIPIIKVLIAGVVHCKNYLLKITHFKILPSVNNWLPTQNYFIINEY